MISFYLFIQMEYCSGGSLKDYIKNRSEINAQKNYSYFVQILNGVQKLHEAGYIHRDLKPANLMIDEFDCIKRQ